MGWFMAATQFFDVVRFPDGTVMLRPVGDATATLFEPPQELLRSGVDLNDRTVTIVRSEPNDLGPGSTWSVCRRPPNSSHAVHTR